MALPAPGPAELPPMQRGAPAPPIQPPPAPQAGAPQAGPHLLSLKVMRASAPSLAVSEKPYFDDAPSTSSNLLAAVGEGISAGLSHDLLSNRWDGSSSSSGVGAAYRSAAENFPISSVLVLPNSFGTLFLGETFRTYVCVRNESGAAVREPSLRVEMQVGASDASQPHAESGRWHQLAHIIMPSPSRYTPDPSDTDGQGRPVWELAPAQALETSLGYDIKDLGPHVLVCTVGYKARVMMHDGQEAWVERSFRKFFKFAVERSPISVRTKVHQPREACAVYHPDPAVRERVHLEVQVQNVASNGSSLVLDRLDLKTAPGWTWSSIDRPSLSSDAQDTDMWMRVGGKSKMLLADGDVRQYLFALVPCEEVAFWEARESGMDMGSTQEGWAIRGDALGHLDISWRMSLGEPGRLQTSQLVRRRVVVAPVSAHTTDETRPTPQLATQLTLTRAAVETLAAVTAETRRIELEVALSVADVCAARSEAVDDDDTPLSEIAPTQREGEVVTVERTFRLALQHCTVEQPSDEAPAGEDVTPRKAPSRTSTPTGTASPLLALNKTRLQANLSNLVRAGSLSLRAGRGDESAAPTPARQPSPAPLGPAVPPKGESVPAPVLSASRVHALHSRWTQHHAQAISRPLVEHYTPTPNAHPLGTSLIPLPNITLAFQARRTPTGWQRLSQLEPQTVHATLEYAVGPSQDTVRLGAVRILLLSFTDPQTHACNTVLDEIPVLAEYLTV
ncbi:uncharacterized protein PSANT_04601 [Moesziomyces antarcticus]|nr:uncharacterized protein PSANT_04601 [Moesziomyces antarcticus]